MGRRSAMRKRSARKARRGTQLPLTHAYRGRGGPRPGAGRPPRPGRRPVAHRRRARVRSSQPQHVTTRLLPDLPSLRTAKAFAAVKTSIARAHKPGFRVVHFSVMRNHVHLLVEARDNDALAAGMKGLKVRITKALNRVWSSAGSRRRGTVFAERYHVRALTSPRETRNGLGYVLNNSRRHAAQAGVRIPKRWVDPCSSARQFDGWRQPVRLEREPNVGAVAPPQTWLLSKGWRRAGGPLDAHHVPAT